MNGKVRRFYEELAAMSGLRLDPEGGALYGTYKGYGVAVLAPNPSYPYQMCAVFSASRPDGPLTKEECKQFLKEHKAAADLSQNGWQITMIIRSGMGQKHLRENNRLPARRRLHRLLPVLRQGDRNRSVLCGRRL